MIKLKNISFKRGNRTILNDISLKLNKGEIFGIVGPSGAGKSTLMQIMSGLLDAEKGEVFLGNERVPGPAHRLIPGHPEIQLVNQEFGLDIYHSVSENLRVKANHLNEKLKIEIIQELLELLELTHLADHKAIELSGGEKQRLALARALIMESKVVLLDEPFAHLDTHIKRSVIDYLIRLKKSRKTTFVFVTHDGQDVLTFADRVGYFNHSKIERIDTPMAFYNFPKSVSEARFFGEINQVTLNKKKYLFRPTQYSLLHSDKFSVEIKLTFKEKIFAGPFMMFIFKASNRNTITLFDTKDISDADKIYIEKN
jgi:iron(III) transport system ATP-binding protein